MHNQQSWWQLDLKLLFPCWGYWSVHLGRNVAVHQVYENAAVLLPSPQQQKFQAISVMSPQPSLHCDESCSGEWAHILPARYETVPLCSLHQVVGPGFIGILWFTVVWSWWRPIHWSSLVGLFLYCVGCYPRTPRSPLVINSCWDPNLFGA